MSAAVLAIMVPWVLGSALFLLASPAAWRSWGLWPAVGAGLGLGLGGLLCSWWLFLVGPPGAGYFTVEASITGVSLLALWRRRDRLMAAPVPAPESSLTLAGLWWPLFVVACLWLVLESAYHAHGGWDAWAIWNLRARFLFRAPEHWQLALSPVLSWSHPDYPLLLPSMVLRGWRLAGNDTTAVPVMVAGMYTFGAVALVRGAVGALRGSTQGNLAGLIMLANYAFLKHGASQFADVELAYFILTAVALMVLAQPHRGMRISLLLLAGLALGLAAWTKNEGQLFALLCLVAWPVSAWRHAGIRSALRVTAGLLLGAAPGLLAVAWLRLASSTESDLLNARTMAALWQHLTDPQRYLIIAEAFGRELAGLGSGILIIVLLYGWWVGREPARDWDPALHAGAWVLSLLLAGYFCVYLITPHDLHWHLGTSLSRLLLQAWPAAVFLWLMALRVPQ